MGLERWFREKEPIWLLILLWTQIFGIHMTAHNCLYVTPASSRGTNVLI